MYCPTCKSDKKHNMITEQFVFRQKIHSVCATCGHSNHYVERQERPIGIVTLEEGKRDHEGWHTKRKN